MNEQIKKAYDALYKPRTDSTWFPFEDGYKVGYAAAKRALARGEEMNACSSLCHKDEPCSVASDGKCDAAQAAQAQQPPKMQFLDRSKEKIIVLLWQGVCDGTVEAFEVNGRMVIPSEEGMTYVRKEDAISFFGLVEQSQAQQEALAKHQPCGCVICTCEHETQCQGCGAKNCGTHAVGQMPNPAYLKSQAQQLSEALKEMEARKDAAYLERNQVVAALAKCFPSGTAKTAIEGWSEDWHGCVYIDLPTGQASWHFHDSHAYLFADLPAYKGKWDGHTTEEKYRRVSMLPAQAQQESQWLPMETAPKDKTKILIKFIEHEAKSSEVVDAWFEDGWCRIDYSRNTYVYLVGREFLGWMPLPPAPMNEVNKPEGDKG